MILGIDPGVTGGLALIKTNPALNLIVAIDMPVTGKLVDPYILHMEVKQMINEHGIDTVVLEDVHSMPAQGVVSSFGFGRSKGVIEGVLASNHLRVAYVSPAAWKRGMALKADKNDSSRLASRLFDTSEHWPLKKHNGRAEAALMAAYWHKISLENR